MAPQRIILLAALLLAFIGCGDDQSHKADSAAKLPRPDPSYIYVVMNIDDRPHLDYEGDGMLKKSTIRLSPTETEFDFELISFRLPAGEVFLAGGKNDDPIHHIVEFTGRIVRSGDSGFSLDGNLRNKVPIVLQFSKMYRADDDSGEEFPELSFDVGEHTVKFEGQVAGWFED